MGLFGGWGSKIAHYAKTKVFTSSVASVALPEATLYTKAGRNTAVGQTELAVIKPYLAGYTGGASNLIFDKFAPAPTPKGTSPIYINPPADGGGGAGGDGGNFGGGNAPGYWSTFARSPMGIIAGVVAVVVLILVFVRGRR